MANILGSILSSTAKGVLVKAGTSKITGVNKKPSAIVKTDSQQSKSGALVIRNTKVNVGRAFPTSGGPTAAPAAIVKSSRGGMSLLDDVIVIKTKVIQIEKLIKNNTLLDRSREETKRKGQRRENFEKREEKLETPKNASAGAKKAQADVPKLGLFGVIKRWLFWTFVGWLFNKYGDQLPKLIPVVKMLGNVAEGIFNFAGNLLKGVVDFIDFGYKAYDNVRNLAKIIGGDNLQQTFDSFSKNFNTFLNLALIAGMATMGGGFGFGKGGVGKGVGGRAAGGFGGRPRVTTSGGGRAGGVDIRNPLRTRPQVTTGMGGKAAKGFGGRAARVLGKGLGRIPIIGGLIDLVINLAMGEPLGRAAAKAVGSTIGAALGTFIPVPFAGTILGGILGDIVGGAVYDTLVKPKDKNKKMATGGKVSIQQGQQKGPIRRKTTRGGKAVGSSVTRGGRRTTVGAARAVTVAPTTRTPILKQIGLKVGSAVGGLFNLFGLFPNPQKEKNAKPAEANKQPNPMGFLEESHKASSRTPFFGSLFSVLTKTILGDRATKLDYKSVAQGLVGLFNQAFADGILRGPASAFASGGVIDLVNAGDSGDFSSWLEKTVESSVAPKMNDVRQDLMRQLMLERDGDKPSGAPGPVPEEKGRFSISGGNEDFWTLVAIASREDGDPQGWADVAQSVYNRLASKAYSGKTIKELITARMQYEPTWKFPKPGKTGVPNPEWYNIKDATSAAAATGQSAKAMESVAAALLNKTYQKNAADFVQGRTDFRGYSVSGGVQRKSGDNYFGWYNNYQANKVASVPSFGATATAVAGGPGPNIPLGAGYGSAGSKIAGELGRFIQSRLKSPQQFQAVTEHPEFGGVKGGHAKNSYHYSGRAIDIGAYTHEQGPILAAVQEFNRMKGVRPVELLHGGNDSGHRDHVHVAYFRGGSTKKGGPIMTHPGEFVIDKDSVDLFGLDFIKKINSVENRADFLTNVSSLMSQLQNLTLNLGKKQKEVSTDTPKDLGATKTIQERDQKDDPNLQYRKMQGGGYIGKNKPSMNLSPLQTQASYEAQGTMMAIQPVIVEKVVQSQGSTGSKIMFGGSGVNSDSNLAAHMRG